MTLPAVISEPGRESSVSYHLPGRWWRNFFESSEDAQVVCDAEGLAVKINPKAARILKLDRSTMEGRFSVFDILQSPADQKLRDTLRHGCIRPEALHSVALMAGDRQNGLVDLELAALDEKHTLVTFKDVALRMRLESHVNRLVTAIDATPDVFFLTDAEGRITFVNPAFHNVTGYDIESVLDRTDEFLRAPSESEKINAYLKKISEGGEWIGELTNLRRDGTPYQVEATISPITDMVGQFIGYVACERDITTRKKLEDDLRLQNDFVRSILQSLDGAIYSLDRDFRVTHANDGWRRLPAEHAGIRLNGPPEIGRPLLDYVGDAARRSELAAIFAEVLSTGHPQDNRFHSLDGHVWMLKISPWVNAGKVRGLICNIADNTHFHELQSQLLQAQKMEAIGTLAGGIAHDFNNILAGILGSAELVREDLGASHPSQEYVQSIMTAAHRARELVQQIFTISRRQDGEKRVLPLQPIVAECIKLLRSTIPAMVKMNHHVDSNCPPVEADPTQIHQVIMNICTNAWHALPDHGGHIEISLRAAEVDGPMAEKHRELHPGTYARLVVSDNGHGMSPAILARIFEPFFTTKPANKGSGLGLSVVHGIVKSHHGAILVDSAQGKGTTFQIYLPARPVKRVEKLQPVQAVPHGHGERILFVDDEPIVGRSSEEFLKRLGYKVTRCEQSREALELFRGAPHDFDLIITDWAMPDMSGTELVSAMHRVRPDIPMLLMSGFVSATMEKAAKTMGVREVLVKPVDPELLAQVVTIVLSRPPTPRTGTPTATDSPVLV